MTDRRSANGDQRLAPQGALFQDVVDELLGEEGAAAALPPALIPVVGTVESSLDLPPNWDTGPMPPLQAGVANNLPPLPPSLGSRSGRERSSRSGSSRTPASRGLSAGYVNPGSGEQRTQDRFEGPDLPQAHRHMGGEDAVLGPSIPPRNLELATPSRPSRPHPGRPATIAFHELGARAYSAYGEYEVNRMIAYRHLNLPAPPINVPPTITDENRDRNYTVRLTAPDCVECHDRHTVIAHRLYVILYSQRPFLCLHRQMIVDLEIEQITIGPPVFLPARIERVIPDHASQSSQAPVNVDKIL